MNKESIPMFKVKMSEKAHILVSEVLASEMIGEGPKVEEFTRALQKRFSFQNVLLLNSGTSAITLAARLIGLKPGDEVISTPFTMIATNVALMPFDAKIIWADINDDNVNISVDSIRKKITSKTKAIVVTHVGGIPCEMDRIMEFDIPIISDCAHAIGTRYNGHHISYWADYSCFSFQSIKQLNTGDGGALIVKDNNKFEMAEKLKWFGMTRKVPYGITRLQHQMTADVPDWGYKMHMNDISASIGIANVECLDDVVNAHIDNANYYLNQLKDVRHISIPTIPEKALPSWWVFYIFVEKRDRFMKYMEERRIVTTPMWRRNDKYSTFKCLTNSIPYTIPYTLPNMDKLQNKIVFIPVGWWLTKDDRMYIVKCIKEFR